MSIRTYKHCPHCGAPLGMTYGLHATHLDIPLGKCMICRKIYKQSNTCEWTVSGPFKRLDVLGFFSSNIGWALLVTIFVKILFFRSDFSNSFEFDIVVICIAIDAIISLIRLPFTWNDIKESKLRCKDKEYLEFLIAQQIVWEHNPLAKLALKKSEPSKSGYALSRVYRIMM